MSGASHTMLDGWHPLGRPGSPYIGNWLPKAVGSHLCTGKFDHASDMQYDSFHSHMLVWRLQALAKWLKISVKHPNDQNDQNDSIVHCLND